MPGPVSAGSMVRALPGALLPCAEHGQHDDCEDHGDDHGGHRCAVHDLGDSTDLLGEDAHQE